MSAKIQNLGLMLVLALLALLAMGCDTDPPVDQCVPQCAGLACGDDGCGGTCGVCDEGFCKDGTCVDICVLDCAGKDCGDNGCGGTCGTCAGGTRCHEIIGICTACTSDCAGKECGDDTCGGSCGTCGAGEACNSGTCASCTPDCAGKQCGDDGCGGDCGGCSAGEACDKGTCSESVCVPQCAGKDCGADGCGGTCGTCKTNETCGGGICADPNCVPDCAGKQCGLDGCGGICAACSIGESCTNHQCTPFCTPKCAGKGCGDDGCGGECGPCGSGTSCVDDACIVASGFLNCGGFRECRYKCEEDDNECLAACVGVTSATAINQSNAFDVCTDEVCADLPTQSEYFACLIDQCDDLAGSCLSIWTGTGDCASLKACMKGCYYAECTNACYGATNPAFWGHYRDASNCNSLAIETKACTPGAQKCISEFCAAIKKKCYGETECVPYCYGIQCGDDGCGGSCGECDNACIKGVCAPNSGSGEGGCGEMVDCLSHCGKGDSNCVVPCTYKASSAGIAGAVTFLKCRDITCDDLYSEQERYACMAEKCAPAAEACDNSWPTGEGDCLSISACRGDCEYGDDACRNLCAQNGSLEAYSLLLDTYKCYSASAGYCHYEDPICPGQLCGAFSDACGESSVCVPHCKGAVCGLDGCGGLCGSCGGGEGCIEGGCVAGIGDTDCAPYRDCLDACDPESSVCANLCTVQSSPDALNAFTAFSNCLGLDCGAEAESNQAGYFTCVASHCPAPAALCIHEFPSGTANCLETWTCSTECDDNAACASACKANASPSGWGRSADYSDCLFGAIETDECELLDIFCLSATCGAVFAACQAD